MELLNPCFKKRNLINAGDTWKIEGNIVGDWLSVAKSSTTLIPT